MSNSTYKIIGKRNPIVSITNEENKEIILQTIGDPHLGRNYRNNLKNRLGDREDYIKESFITLLNQPSDMTVIMGDLLDKVVITNEWFSFTIKSIEDAVKSNPNKKYIILNGNHDEVKDKSRISSFSLIVNYFSQTNYNNLIFVNEECLSLYLEDMNLDLVFTNYNPFKKEFNYQLHDGSLRIAFGHFDIDLFEYIDKSKFIDHCIPNHIDEQFDLIVNGHFHKPCILNSREFNTPIVITGSMQPYAFGEEIREDKDLYVTLNVNELRGILEENPEHFINSNLRILYKREDELVSDVNCYSISYKLIQEELSKTQQDIEFKIEPFANLFLNVLDQHTTDENKLFIENIRKAFMEKEYESN